MIENCGRIFTLIARSGTSAALVVILASCGGEAGEEQSRRPMTAEEVFDAERAAYDAAPQARATDAGAQFPYQLDEAAKGEPFLVEAMWTDGRYTYLRSKAQKRIMLYTKIGQLRLPVEKARTEDGLYIVYSRIRIRGELQIDNETVAWRIIEPEAVQ